MRSCQDCDSGKQFCQTREDATATANNFHVSSDGLGKVGSSGSLILTSAVGCMLESQNVHCRGVGVVDRRKDAHTQRSVRSFDVSSMDSLCKNPLYPS